MSEASGQKPMGGPDQSTLLKKGATAERTNALTLLGGETGNEVFSGHIVRFLYAGRQYQQLVVGDSGSPRMVLLNKAVSGGIHIVEGRDAAVEIFRGMREDLESFIQSPEGHSEETERQARAFEGAIQLLQKQPLTQPKPLETRNRTGRKKP